MTLFFLFRIELLGDYTDQLSRDYGLDLIADRSFSERSDLAHCHRVLYIINSKERLPNCIASYRGLILILSSQINNGVESLSC